MKNVLITGSSRGIGAECAREFSKHGYRVFVNFCNSEKRALDLANEIGAIAIRADVSKSCEVKEMIEEVSKYGGVDVLVNNAGVAKQLVFSDITEEEWDRIFDINVKGMFLVTKGCLPHMIHEKKGKIINISSIWGQTGGSCEVHYSASKSAVIGFTKALAKELGPSNIQVNCIAPGLIDTEMNSAISEEDIREIENNEIPLERIGNPSEVAKLACFLAADESDYITGQIIGINGGMYI